MTFQLNLPVAGTNALSSIMQPQLSMLPLPKICLDALSFSNKLKHPIHSETFRLPSVSCSKSYNGIYHNFVLPGGGDYSHGFTLQFPYLIKAIKDGQLWVDCASNYIESVSLSVNNSSAVIAKIDQIPKVTTKTFPDLQTSVLHRVSLDFLDIPLLTKYVNESNYQISIKFRQSPPSEYELVYDVMFVDQKLYYLDLRKEEFMITYIARQPHHHKKVEMMFKDGSVWIK